MKIALVWSLSWYSTISMFTNKQLISDWIVFQSVAEWLQNNPSVAIFVSSKLQNYSDLSRCRIPTEDFSESSIGENQFIIPPSRTYLRNFQFDFTTYTNRYLQSKSLHWQLSPIHPVIENGTNYHVLCEVVSTALKFHRLLRFKINRCTYLCLILALINSLITE